MTRDAGRLRDVPWADQVEVVEADALGGPALERALAGVDVAYYLVHSIGAGRAFERTDRNAAAAFAAAARTAGVGRLVYLGGLVPAQRRLSPHLASRAEVGQVLLDSGVPTVVLQAAVILSLLRLRAEMRLPGAAWLELKVERDADGRTVYVQRALFHPRGLAGHAYWWAVAPLHGVVFGGMLAGVARAAERARPSGAPHLCSRP
jgi:hypothetical protein